MKYKNRNDYGKKIRLGNEEVEISMAGDLIHKVEGKAKELMKEFADFFYDEKAKPKKVKEAKDTSEVESIYKEKIEYLQRVISQQKEELKQKDKDIEMYRKLASESASTTQKEVAQKIEKTKQDEVSEMNQGETKQVLAEKTLAQLKDICVEMKLPQKEWSSLNKTNLIEYLSK